MSTLSEQLLACWLHRPLNGYSIYLCLGVQEGVHREKLYICVQYQIIYSLLISLFKLIAIAVLSFNRLRSENAASSCWGILSTSVDMRKTIVSLRKAIKRNSLLSDFIIEQQPPITLILKLYHYPNHPLLDTDVLGVSSIHHRNTLIYLLSSLFYLYKITIYWSDKLSFKVG